MTTEEKLIFFLIKNYLERYPHVTWPEKTNLEIANEAISYIYEILLGKKADEEKNG